MPSDRKHWKAMLPTIQAFVDGKDVLYDGETGYELSFTDYPDSYTIAEPPKLRPYNADEMKALVGKVLVDKELRLPFLVLLCDGANRVQMYSRVKDADELLANWTHADGSPCGVLEETT